VTGAEVVSHVQITEVWAMLGGPPLRNGRGKRFWKDGDGYNIRLRDDLNVWKDFVTGQKGGILALIETVLDCDKRTALRFLADRLHLDIDQPLTLAQRRAYHDRRRRDEQLQYLRRRLIAQLKVRRNMFWTTDRLACAWARTADAGDWRWEVFWLHCRDGEIGNKVQAEIERIEAMNLDQLAAFFSSSRRRAA
jgi:hypothetical protein